MLGAGMIPIVLKLDVGKPSMRLGQRSSSERFGGQVGNRETHLPPNPDYLPFTASVDHPVN